MSEHTQYKQLNTKNPELQDITMSLIIGGIAYELSQRLDISPSLGPCPLLQKQDLQAVA